MLFSQILKNKFLKGSVLHPSDYAPTIAQWAQQLFLSHHNSNVTNMKLSPETINVKKTLLTFELFNSKVKVPAKLEFYEDGIFNFSVNNPNNKSGFSFYDVEERPKLKALHPHFTDKSKIRMVLVFSDNENFASSTYKSKYKLIIDFEPFKMQLMDANEKVIMEFNGNNDLNFASEHVMFDIRFPTHHLYGLAERADHTYLKDSKTGDTQREPYKLSARDNPKYQTNSPIGLYGSVPLLVNLYDENTKALTGVFQANASETYVEVNKNYENHSDVVWLNSAGDIEIYVIASEGMKDFFYKSAQVTGFSYMPPLWALGFHQCRWGYLNENMVDEVNDKLKEHKIPCDSVTLDIDYTDGFKYFTWNQNTFPDPDAMIKRIRKNKRKLVTINDPHIKQDEDYHVYKESKEKGYFIRDPQGETFVNLCWPGKSSWLDYTNPAVQDYWASLYHYKNYPYTTRDVHAWNDMNEPAVFDAMYENTMNPHNRHTFYKDGEKREVEHKYVHNMYGFLQTKSTFKGMIERDAPNKYRPFILTRSFFAGTQKYSAIWSGDSGSKWTDLAIQVPMALTTSICGISFCGGDVGGFMGDPSQECAVRWYQAGSFMAYFRAHSDMNTKRREPYTYEPLYRTAIIKTIQERYRWIYYWYNCFEEYVRTGFPILRPIWMDVKNKDKLTLSLLKEDSQYFVGDSLLVIPVVERYKRYVKIHDDLQKEEWFTIETGYLDKSDDVYKTELEKLGVFIRGGSIIPFVDLPEEFLSTEDIIDRPLHLFITLGKSGQATGTLYYDDYETFDYEKKHYVRRTFEFKDMKLSNKLEDLHQLFESIKDKEISMITICGTSEDICQWKMTNAEKYNLSDYKIDLTHAEHKMIRFTNLHLSVKTSWTLEFSK